MAHRRSASAPPVINDSGDVVMGEADDDDMDAVPARRPHTLGTEQSERSPRAIRALRAIHTSILFTTFTLAPISTSSSITVMPAYGILWCAPSCVE